MRKCQKPDRALKIGLNTSHRPCVQPTIRSLGHKKCRMGVLDEVPNFLRVLVVCMNEFRSRYHQDFISRSLSGFNYPSNPFNAGPSKVFQSLFAAVSHDDLGRRAILAPVDYRPRQPESTSHPPFGSLDVRWWSTD